MRLRPRLTFILALSAFVSACAHFPASGPDRTPAARYRDSAETPIEGLRRSIDTKRAKVAEFAFLKDWGQRRGYRIWIAGGSAAGFAHYVKADLARDALAGMGKPSGYLDSRFKYKYYQIFRSTQDADIVIDASEAEALELEKALRSRFDYLQGSKSAWEVRLLRSPRGTGPSMKEPLIENANFLNQNSDSHSTGMIELTDPPRGESTIRDLFDWHNHDTPTFLRDVFEGKLHFYSNLLHATTARARAGLNPPILSVIRYFTKAFQYGLSIREEDLPEIKRVIDEFSPGDPKLQTARGQIESNARKLYAHAESLESAYLTLEKYGLRKKLIAFGGVPKVGTMSALLSRLPLLEKPYGASGKTARELFGDAKPIVVAHETSDILAYESITRSRRGKPNVLTSRPDVAGEAAVHGEGFYTKIGREGARDTGLTIRFELDPDAREGEDFIYVRENDYVVVKNKRALRLIDESVELTPVDFFRFVAETKVGKADLGLWKMMGTIIQSDLSQLTPLERGSINSLAVEAMKANANPAWISNFLLPIPSLRADLIRIVKAMPPEERGAIGLRFWELSDPGSHRDPIDEDALNPWREFLREADVFGESRKHVGPTLDRILAATARRTGVKILLPPLLPNDSYSLDNAAKHLLKYAVMIEGSDAVKARIEALPFEHKSTLLHLINEAVSSYGHRRTSDEHHYLFEWIRDRFLSDSSRPADLYKTWDASKTPSGLLDVRFRIGPLSETETRSFLNLNLHSWSENHGVRDALKDSILSADPQAISSATKLALRLSQEGKMDAVDQRVGFLSLLIDHVEIIQNAPDFPEVKAQIRKSVAATIRVYSQNQYTSISDQSEAFLIHAFSTPEVFEPADWLAFVEMTEKSQKTFWKSVLGGALVEGYGRNPYFLNRGDLLVRCFQDGRFQFGSWGISRDDQSRGLSSLARDFHGLIGEKVQVGILTKGDLFKHWTATCPDLLK